MLNYQNMLIYSKDYIFQNIVCFVFLLVIIYKLDITLKYIYTFLQRNDPLAANSINMNDPTRVIRATEVFDQTGISIRDWQKNTGNILIKKDYLRKDNNIKS